MSLSQANIIDAMGVDESTGRVILIIRHDTEWDGSDTQLYLLQEKLNAYLSFALDGEMEQASPDFAGRPVGLIIESVFPPDPRTLHLLAHVRQQLSFQDIPLEMRVHEGSPAPDGSARVVRGCGSGCGCHGQ